MCDENTLASHGTFTWIVSPHIQLFFPAVLVPTLFSLSFLRHSVSQIPYVYCWPKYKCVFSYLDTNRKKICKSKKMQHFWLGCVLVSLWDTLYRVHVLPLYTVSLRTAYCRIQTFLMDLSPGFYEALPSDLKTTTRVALNHKITRRKKPSVQN